MVGRNIDNRERYIFAILDQSHDVPGFIAKLIREESSFADNLSDFPLYNSVFRFFLDQFTSFDLLDD
jgi:hypothetical protein